MSQTQSQPTHWYDRTAVVLLLLVVLWPVGVYALFRNGKMGVLGKLFVGGAVTCALFFGAIALAMAAFFFVRHDGSTAITSLNNMISGKRETVAPNVDPTTHDGPVDDKSFGGKDERKAEPLNATSSAKPETIFASPLPDTKPEAPAEQPNPFATPTPAPVAEKIAVVAVPPVAAPTDPLTPTVTFKQGNAPMYWINTDSPHSKVVPFVTPLPNTPREEPKPPVPNDPPADDNAAQLQKLIDEARQREAAKKAGGTIPAPAAPTPAPAPDGNAAELLARVGALQSAKQQQAAQSEKLLGDFQAAAAVETNLQNLELAFRDNLRRTYNSERFDQGKFDEFFTDEYLRNYNAQIAKQQNALLAYAKSLQETGANLSQQDAALRAQCAAAHVDVLPADPALDGKMQSLNARLRTLAPRLVTLADVRQAIGAKAQRQPVVVTPPVVVAPPPLRPVVPTAPPVVVAPPPVLTADMPGVWVRSDGKVTWNVIGNGTIVGVNRETNDKSKFKWGFDERTGTLTVNHGGTLQLFTVVNEGADFVMRGSNAAGGTALHFRRRR